jgi:hypothetical protein
MKLIQEKILVCRSALILRVFKGCFITLFIKICYNILKLEYAK